MCSLDYLQLHHMERIVLEWPKASGRIPWVLRKTLSLTFQARQMQRSAVAGDVMLVFQQASWVLE